MNFINSRLPLDPKMAIHTLTYQINIPHHGELRLIAASYASCEEDYI
jgi:hypothetical protein